MKKSISMPFATTAILTLAEIKAAVEAFDRGESNVFNVLEAITVAVETQQAAMAGDKWRERPHQDAA